MTVYLLVTGLFFLAFGLFSLLMPLQAVALPYSIGADEVDARNYLRSGAGGVTLACAALFLAGAAHAELAVCATVTAVVVLGGLVGGRLFSLVFDGMPSKFVRFAAVGELTGVIFGLFWLIQA